MSKFVRGASALTLLLTLAATSLVTFAFADEASGTITKVDAENLAIVLEDGSRYVIPEEFYVEDLKPGMTIQLQFDVIDGAKIISDLEVEG